MIQKIELCIRNPACECELCGRCAKNDHYTYEDYLADKADEEPPEVCDKWEE